jgi:hypothetical protein
MVFDRGVLGFDTVSKRFSLSTFIIDSCTGQVLDRSDSAGTFEFESGSLTFRVQPSESQRTFTGRVERDLIVVHQEAQLVFKR